LIFSESTCSGAYQVSDGFFVQAIWVNKSLSMMWRVKRTALRLRPFLRSNIPQTALGHLQFYSNIQSI
jgi:hypothetical protein